MLPVQTVRIRPRMCSPQAYATRLSSAETWLCSDWPTAAMSMAHRRLEFTRPYSRVAALYSLACGLRRTPSVRSSILAGSAVP